MYELITWMNQYSGSYDLIMHYKNKQNSIIIVPEYGCYFIFTELPGETFTTVIEFPFLYSYMHFGSQKHIDFQLHVEVLKY